MPIAEFEGRSPQDWLERAQDLMLRREPAAGARLLRDAITAHPHVPALRLALGGALLEAGHRESAEAVLRELLATDPGDHAAGFLLAPMLMDAGRTQAMAEVLRGLFAQRQGEVDDLLQAVELLDEAQRQHDAAALCEAEIAAGCTDPRVHAHAGMLLSQLGQFDLARTRRLYALSHTDQALDWHVPLGLAEQQRYTNADHEDFARFQAYLQRPSLKPSSRAALLFALGKAHDDIGEYARAAGYFMEANAIVHASVRWSRKQWRRSLEAHLGRRLPQGGHRAPADWAPLFIVGMPRSGSTLLAELLARHPQVCHRGELPWLPTLAADFESGASDYPAYLERTATRYAAQLRQDDGSTAYWFIDKQPRNFLYVDLILALFPNARIIHCERGARDNALSLWMQSFQPGTQDFAYDFADIGAAIQGSRRLMTHWLKRYPGAIRMVTYESMISDAAGCLAELSAWLGLSPYELPGSSSTTASINTASLWQVRQPIHTRSVQRWRHYAVHLPKLLRIQEKQ